MTGFAVAAQTPTTTVDVLNGLKAGSHPALGEAKAGTSSTSWLVNSLGVPAGALVVNTPGTDDTTLYPRIDPMRGNLNTAIIDFPQSLFPFVSGRSGAWLPIFAPTFDESVKIAVDHNLQTMRGLNGATDAPYAVYSGYSQGAEAVGDATEQAYAAGLLDPNRTRIVLVSDPRSPWGIKQWATRSPLVSTVINVIGVTADGARNPANTGVDLQVASVIVDGDPVANFQWVWYRPVASLVVDVAGFLAIHSGMGPESYATLDQIEDKEVLHSQDGKTTYVVYHAEHPLTQGVEMAAGVVGIHFNDTQIDQLNEFNNWFYPLQQPSPERAAATAPVMLAGSQDVDTLSDVPAENTPPRAEGTVGKALPREVGRPKMKVVGTSGLIEQDGSAASARTARTKDAVRAIKNSQQGRTSLREPSAHRSAPRDNAA